MSYDTHFVPNSLLRLNTMRSYIFAAMLVVVAIPFGFMMHHRQQAAFERELVKVEQAHLVIAENLASTLQRYTDDVVSTFDFLAANHDNGYDAAALDPLLRSYGIRYMAAIDVQSGSDALIYARDFALPPSEARDLLRDTTGVEQTQISGVRPVAGEPMFYLTRQSRSGVLFLAALETSYLIALQKQVAFGERGHAMIVDHRGRVIAHPNPEWTQTAKDASGLEVVQRMTGGQTGVMQFFAPPLKADVIAGYTSVPSTNWGVMVPQPISELWDAANVEAVELLKTLLLLFLLAGAAGWLLSGLIVRPLNKIAQTVVQLRDGDTSARVPPLGRATPREIGAMQSLLNGLLDNWVENRTILEKALQAAKNANASKSQAISVLSHEMRTPLNGILGATELMDSTQLDPAQRKYLGIVGTSANTLLEHVNRVLEVSRLDSSTVTIERAPVHIRDLLSDIVSENSPQAEKSGNSIVLSLADDLPRVIETDHQKLRNIVANLVSNAVKFTHGGQIHIRAALSCTDHLELTVRDTGPGIAAAQTDFVFEPFAVIDSSFGRGNEGTGLGLCIVKMSAECLGGHVRLVSDPGHGSAFSVSLPVGVLEQAQSPAKPASMQDRGVQSGGRVNQPARKRILVVDDNEINRIVLAAMIERVGHEVQTAVDGHDALGAAMVDRFDLILMDISMPEIDGTEVARLIRDHDGPNQATTIIAQTAHARPEDTDRFHSAGIQDVLIKPITQQALEKVLKGQLPQAADLPVSAPLPADQTSFDIELFELLASAQGPTNALQKIDRLLRETTEVLDGLNDVPLSQLDTPETLAQVHNVAGACGMFGAKDLHAHLLRIEIQLKDRITDGIDELLTRAKRSAQKTRFEAERMLAS